MNSRKKRDALYVLCWTARVRRDMNDSGPRTNIDDLVSTESRDPVRSIHPLLLLANEIEFPSVTPKFTHTVFSSTICQWAFHN